MRLRVFLCFLALLCLLGSVALADTVTYGDTIYVFPDEPAEAATLTLSVDGSGFDPETFAPVSHAHVSGAVFGVYAKDAQGGYVPLPDPENPLQRVQIVSGAAPVTVALPLGVDLYITQETAAEGYVVDAESGQMRALSLPETLVYTNPMEGMQGIWLTLTGNGAPEPTPLEGVRFTLSGQGETHTLETDALGNAVLFGIAPGTYTLRQETEAEGYRVGEAERTIEIIAHEPLQVALENDRDGVLALRTLGLVADGNQVSRVLPIARRYEVHDAEGALLAVLENGETLPLPAAATGTEYTLVAIGGDGDGFTADTQTHTVTLYPGQTTTCQTLARSEKGFFQFEHIAAGEGKAVAGGSFALYDENGDLVLNFEADAEGKFSPDAPLAQGAYVIHMIHAAEGYQYASEPLMLQIEPFMAEGFPVARATFASRAVPDSLLHPVVTADEQEVASLFDADAEISFTLYPFEDVPDLPVDDLQITFEIPQVEGLTVVEQGEDSAAVRIDRRLALEGTEEVTELVVSGTIAYTFRYPVDAEGGEVAVPVSAPFEVVVATFLPQEYADAFDVTGHLTDENGQPISGYRVAVQDAQTGKTLGRMATDPFGAYAFAGVPEDAVLTVEPPEGYGVRLAEQSAQFLPLRTVSGRVRVEGGVKGMPVMLAIGEEEPIAPDADGSFSITGVFSEDAQLAAEVPEGVLATVAMAAGEAEVTLYAAASVAGEVLDPEGTPVQGLTVRLSSAKNNKSVKTDAQGRYTIGDLLPDKYTLTLLPPSGYVLNSEGILTVVLAAGEAWTDGDAQAMRPATVEGKLMDGDLPYAGIAIALLPDGIECMTDEEGHFAFEGLQAGEYALALDTPEETIVLDLPESIAISTSGQRSQHVVHTVRPASISGRIWFDENDDGLMFYDETGLEGVRVALLDAQETEVSSVDTAADGAFAFEGLTPGQYRLAVTLPEGMIFAREAPDAERIVVGVDAREGISEWYTLGSDEKKSNLICGGVIPGSIEGLIWEDINGDGVMQHKEPLQEGIEVALLREEETVRTVLTDAEGRYRIDKLRMGDYTLRVTLPEDGMFTAKDQADAASVGSQLPMTEANVSQMSVSLRRWRMEWTVNAGFQRAASVAAALWFDTRATGNNPGDAGYEGLGVALHTASGQLVSQTETDGEGHVRFDRVRPGVYQLRYTLPEAQGWGFTTGVQQTAGGIGSTGDFTLANGAQVEAEDAGVTMLGRISGHVFEDADYDGIRGEQEYGVPAAVALVDASGAVVMEGETRPNGSYAFEGVQAGRYRVRFTLPEAYAFTKNREDAPSFNSDVAETAQLSAETDLLYLPMGEALQLDAGAYRRVSIAGTAWQDVAGHGGYAAENPGVAGVTVSLLQDGQTLAEVVTDETGTYRFGDLAPGTYTIGARLPEGWRFSEAPLYGGRGSAMAVAETLQSEAEAIAVKSGDQKTNIDIGAVQNGAVVGTVINEKNGEGFAGAQVTLLRDGEALLETETDAQGRYRFADVRPGRAQVRFSVDETWVIPETVVNPVDVTIPQGMDSEPADIHCVPEAVFAGFLWLDADADGKATGEDALEGAYVELYAVSGEELVLLDVQQTDAEGQYRFARLMPGTYKLQFRAAEDIVFYDGGETEHIDLAMGELTTIDGPAFVASTVSGIVWEDLNNNGLHERDEAGIPEASLALLRQDGTVMMETVTDETGAFVFERVPPGVCMVRYTLPQAFIYVTPMEGGSVVPQVDTYIAMGPELTLAMGDAVTNMHAGAVRHTRIGDLVWLDENGNGLQDTVEPGIGGIVVTLLKANEEGGAEPVAETETDPHGHYRFDNVRPGSYIIRVSLGDAYMPTKPFPQLGQINSKLPWQTGESLETEPFVAQSGRHELSIDAGLVTAEMAASFGWEIDKDGTIRSKEKDVK